MKMCKKGRLGLGGFEVEGGFGSWVRRRRRREVGRRGCAEKGGSVREGNREDGGQRVSEGTLRMGSGFQDLEGSGKSAFGS